MSQFAEAFEKAKNRMTFKVKKILIDGSEYEPLVSEESIIRLLTFKGTGEKRKFLDLVKEVEQMAMDEMGRVWENGGEMKHTPWIDEYVIENNFQVVFLDGDLILRNKTN